ncbi:MAG: E3 binding domain-containing protein, partial [Anaerolineae bacterium]|nr:E3 binding domain-containing protein [Anaerolineae bacterium]
MATEVIMPKVDMVMETGTFVEWLKQEGEQVQKGEPLFVILTDKANIEIEAPASGILAGVRAKPDDVIPVTHVIAYLLQPGEELPAAGAPRPTSAVQAPGPTQPATPEQATVAAAPAIAATASPAGKVRATPVARRIAAERGIDLALLEGRGPGGRIHKADVLEFRDRPAEISLPARPAAPVVIPLPDARRKAVVA